MANYKIGYIDEQEGERLDFINLMDDDEDSIEVVIFNVDATTEIGKLMEEILQSDIECLVADYHLSETGVPFEGSHLIEEFHKIRPYFPKIIYTAKEDKVIPEVENEIIYFINDKSIKQDEKRSEDFRTKIKTLINNYQKDIDVAKQALKTLTEKRRNEKLTIDEENELFKAKNYLMKIDTRRIEFPEILTEQDYFKDVQESNKKVDEILKEMRNVK
ncbi:hypothetical protein K6119_01735 [Paracrocinitomix mangrovi]|uniref:hypothetical protein n=1 Tax=Paracrocinitomix mangrovi TaxID=2862509 RepID=UPI001C8D19EF|nr:hypothetical protein [Paracrocinitomix mangrovi]UKN02238.1 hypothetical protein K6119_01735 [Paracrocinitomix mangrovi]